jgi:ergothioneine biosynthesis protein EgtB
MVQEQNWQAPLYWFNHEGEWSLFTLAGRVPVDANEPVCHVSYFEADAFARWAQARLPTEAEWEIAAAGSPIEGSFADVLFTTGRTVHPSAAPKSTSSITQRRESSNGNQKPVSAAPQQMFGELWQWTASSYSAYPGYQAPAGALGEYNGKFMCNQYVLRGGSCATPSGHIRATYRNFFPPEARWQFSGIRLARYSDGTATVD